MNSSTSPIDISVIKGLLGEDEEIINIFMQKFLNSVPGDMKEIRNAISSQDYSSTKAKAHKLKSSAKAIGANDLAAICQKIEDTSTLNEQALLDDLYNAMTQEFSRCEQYINSTFN